MGNNPGLRDNKLFMNDMQIAFASHTWSKETPVECYSVTCDFESRVDVLDEELMSCDLSCKLLAACVCRVCAYPSIRVSDEYVFEMGRSVFVACRLN